MAWSYSGDPSTGELDEYRFLIGDTDVSEPVLQNEEILYLLGKSQDVDTRLYHLFSTATTVFARAIKRSLGPQSEDPTSRLAYFTKQAVHYANKLTGVGISVPVYGYPKAFSKGMHNNV